MSNRRNKYLKPIGTQKYCHVGLLSFVLHVVNCLYRQQIRQFQSTCVPIVATTSSHSTQFHLHLYHMKTHLPTQNWLQTMAQSLTRFLTAMFQRTMKQDVTTTASHQISLVSQGHIPEWNKYYLPWSKNFHLPGTNRNYWSAHTLILKKHEWQTGTPWRKIHMQVWRWKLLIYSSLHSWCIFYLSLEFPNILISWYMLFDYIFHVWITNLFCILVNVMKHWGEWIRENIIDNMKTLYCASDNK